MIWDPRTCTYGPAHAGVDVSIDGDIWAGSPLDLHLESTAHAERCDIESRKRDAGDDYLDGYGQRRCGRHDEILDARYGCRVCIGGGLE